MTITDPSRASTPTQGPSTTPLPTFPRRLEYLAPVGFGASGLVGPVAQPLGEIPVVAVFEEDPGGALSDHPALQVAETVLAVGVELVVGGVAATDGSAVGDFADGGGFVDELLVVALRDLVGLQIEALRQ